MLHAKLNFAAILVCVFAGGCATRYASPYHESWAEQVKVESDACPLIDGEYLNAGEQFDQVEHDAYTRSTRSLAHILNGGDSRQNDGAPVGTRPLHHADDRLGETWHDPSRDAYQTIRLRLVGGMLSVEASLADGSNRAFDLPTRQRCRNSTLLLEPAWYFDSFLVTNMVGRDSLALGRAEDGSLLVLETRTREMFVILTPLRETATAWIRFPAVAMSPERRQGLASQRAEMRPEDH
jgi:hypothetical protein